MASNPLRALPAAALLLTLPALAAPAGAGQAPATGQKPPAARRPSVFQQVVPQPTGRNGYEELVLAAEAFQASRYYQKAQEADLTLEQKRVILADRQVIRALSLLRQGLQKPVLSPREKVGITTLLPEFALFRSLSRLLALQQYVYLADGRGFDAIGNARLGLRFSQAIQTDTLIAGLVGIAMGAVCIRPLADHLDQLSSRDCEALYQLCVDWLRQESPQIRIMSSEVRMMQPVLTELRDTIRQKGFSRTAKDFGLDEGAQEWANALPMKPEELDAAFAETGKRLQTHWERVLAEMRKPYWERTEVPLPDETDFAGAITRSLLPSYNRVADAYTKEAARIRLLACHCLIRRYKWEHNRLPADLAVVRPGELAVDPFTGQFLKYTVRGSRYSLTSAGAPATDPDDPNVVNGRMPVSLTPDD